MKSPSQIADKLKRQWHNSNKREYRLLSGGEAWPISESIGKPKPKVMANDLDGVIQHNNAWKQIKTGKVIWESVKFRAAAEPVSVPISWQLNKPSEWIQACSNQTIQREFDAMAQLVEKTDPALHSLLIRRRSLWQNKPLHEVIQACRVAATLTPGYANGKPLRTLSLENIDTKFFERHARLITKLLDTRFEDEVSAIGLEMFLDALQEGDHWLLVIDLDGSQLPFNKQRVSTKELARTNLPGRHLLIVENERCQHQLPVLKNTIAVLGAGFDLDWTNNPNFTTKHIGYWGDIDTWGLQCLSKARAHLPHLQTLMMNEEVYNAHLALAVCEPVAAGQDVPDTLSAAESALYNKLLTSDAGRLEQEFLPDSLVQQTVTQWRNSTTNINQSEINH